MDDGVQNGLQAEQWLPTLDKGEKRPSSLGSGALRFIRTRSSIRRELKRQCNRNKSGDSYGASEGNGGGGGGGGGLGKWLREHLGGGGSRGSHDISVILPSKANGSGGPGSPENEKSFGRTISASQNLYCSLPREHGRHVNNGTRKTGHGGSLKPQGHDRPRSNSVNHHEKSTSGDLGPLTRGGPIYSSEGKSLKKRNRDRRRHSLNETHEHTRHRRRSMEEAETEEIANEVAPDEKSYDVQEPKSKSHISITASGSDVSPQYDYVFDFDDLDTAGEIGYEYEAEEGYYEAEEGEKPKKEGVAAVVEEKTTFKMIQEDWDFLERRSEAVKAVKSLKAVKASSFVSEVSSEKDEEYVGEEELPEEIAPLSRVSLAEKAEEEEDVVEYDHVLAEIPAEVLASREAMIEMVKELLAEQPELWKRNRLLEQYVAKYMKQNRHKVILASMSQLPEHMNEFYKDALVNYKLRMDEIIAEQERLAYEIEEFQSKVDAVAEEDQNTFDELLRREREVGIGLVYAKTGKKLTEKACNGITQRQTQRRKILTRDRYHYILLQRRYEQLQHELQNVETLGEGMTSMDYDALLLINISHKDKLDERNRELEKLRSKIHEVVNGVAHFKEKQVCLVDNIEREEKELKEHQEQTMKVREHMNNLHLALRAARETYAKKKREAGLLVAQPELRQMERTMKLLETQKNNIELIKEEIQQYAGANVKRLTADSHLNRLP